MLVFAFAETLRDMLSYPFLVRAVIVGLLVSLCASLLGVSLVLKRYSMIGDGLSHVGFGALALATALNAAPLTVCIPIVVLAAFLLLRLSENSAIKGDAAIALISTASLALGVIVISLTTGMNTDVCNYLFGSILVMSKADVYLSVILSVVVLALFILFYHKIFAVTFDETFAKATGTKTGMYNMLIAFLTAITIVLGMRMMGALLISALIIFPALTSMRLCKRFMTVTISAAVISVICFFIGIVISYAAPKGLPTGASVVMVNIIAFCLFGLINIVKQRSSNMKTMKKMKKISSITLILTVSFTFFTLFTGCNASTANGTSTVNAASGKLALQIAESTVNSTDTITLSGYSGTVNNTGLVPAGLLSQAAPQASQQLVKSAQSNSNKGLIEIKEKMFIAQINDIYLNPEDYIGKTLKLEGMFHTEQGYTLNGDTYYSVFRYGPGCCGADGIAALEVMWEDRDKTYPKEKDWVEAAGEFGEYETEGYSYFCIKLSSLTVLEKRGAEYVAQ